MALSAVVCLSTLTEPAPACLEIAALSKAASLLAAGLTPEVAGVSCRAVALARHVVRAILVASLKTGSCLLAFGVLSVGIGLFGTRTLASRSFTEPQEKPQAARVQADVVIKAISENLQKDSLPDGALARIGSTRFRSPGGICSVAFSPDGRRLAYERERTRLYLQAASGKPLLDWSLRHRPVTGWLSLLMAKLLLPVEFGPNPSGSSTSKRTRFMQLKHR